MTAAKVLDTVLRVPGMSGEANDAVSAYTQVKMSDASRLLARPVTECPTVWIGLPRNRRPKHLDNIDDPMVPWERNLYGHPLAKLHWERRLEEVLLQESWRKRTQLRLTLFFIDTLHSFYLSVDVDDKKWLDEKPAWLLCGLIYRKRWTSRNRRHSSIKCISDAHNVDQ